jgi:hypothetical protein
LNVIRCDFIYKFYLKYFSRKEDLRERERGSERERGRERGEGREGERAKERERWREERVSYHNCA